MFFHVIFRKPTQISFALPNKNNHTHFPSDYQSIIKKSSSNKTLPLICIEIPIL